MEKKTRQRLAATQKLHESSDGVWRRCYSPEVCEKETFTLAELARNGGALYKVSDHIRKVSEVIEGGFYTIRNDVPGHMCVYDAETADPLKADMRIKWQKKFVPEVAAMTVEHWRHQRLREAAKK